MQDRLALLPQVYFINRKGDTDRRERCERVLSETGFEPICWQALEPHSTPDALRARFVAGSEQCLSGGEMACFASHLQICKHISQQPDNWYFVAEDDVAFRCSASELHAALALVHDVGHLDIIRSTNFPKCPSQELASNETHKLVDFFVSSVRSEFYMIRPRGASVILKHAHDIRMPYDIYLKTLERTELRSGWVVPPLTTQEFDYSCIETEGTTRNQANRSYRFRNSGFSVMRELAYVRRFGLFGFCRMLTAYGLMHIPKLKPDAEFKYMAPASNKRAVADKSRSQ